VLERSASRVTSPIAIFEATLGLCRVRHATVDEAAADVAEFLTVAEIECVPITEQEAQTALMAFARYGKGRGHPAQLNLGDCFAYAAARNRNMLLLFKGDDFTKNDIEPAVSA
jgi:ribonuclease VapC